MIIEGKRPPAYWPSDVGGVVVEDLVISYAPTLPPVIKGVSFEIQPREKVGVVGRTGSGKSTMALSLLRFTDPTSGRILCVLPFESAPSSLTAVFVQDRRDRHHVHRSRGPPFPPHSDTPRSSPFQRHDPIQPRPLQRALGPRLPRRSRSRSHDLGARPASLVSTLSRSVSRAFSRLVPSAHARGHHGRSASRRCTCAECG
jgi:energy-coupling factor transporter ATP-binding protein EcfA2